MLSPEALEALQAHPWPGNVRELEHCIYRAMVLNRGYVLDATDIHRTLDTSDRPPSFLAPLGDDERQREIVQHYLATHPGEMAHARFLEMIDKLLGRLSSGSDVAQLVFEQKKAILKKLLGPEGVISVMRYAHGLKLSVRGLHSRS